MGLIILKNPTQEQTDFVRDLSNQYELTEKINKVFYDGTICQYMNMLLYKKFKLPKKVNDMILTWTDTKNLLEKYKTYLDIIILGGLMAYYLEHKVDYYQINQEVLKSFNIQNENQFEYQVDIYCFLKRHL